MIGVRPLKLNCVPVSILVGLLLIGCAQREVFRFRAKRTVSPPQPTAAAPKAPRVRAASLAPPANTGAQNLEVHFINVGQGDCTLVKCPGGDSILVDCGSTVDADPNAVRSYVLSQLDQTDPKIDLLVVTHPDADHYNLLPSVLSGIDVKKILAVGNPSEHSSNNVDDWLDEFVPERYEVFPKDRFDSPGHPSSYCDCGPAEIFILAANLDGDLSPKNTRSIVLLIKHGDFEIILTGDATRVTEKKISERYPADWLDVEVLKVGHHGSLATSTSPEWASVTKPEVSIVSSSYTNTFGHPRKEVLQRLIPYADSVSPHRIRWATKSGGSYNFRNVYNFNQALYCTAANGTVV